MTIYQKIIRCFFAVILLLCFMSGCDNTDATNYTTEKATANSIVATTETVNKNDLYPVKIMISPSAFNHAFLFEIDNKKGSCVLGDRGNNDEILSDSYITDIQKSKSFSLTEKQSKKLCTMVSDIYNNEIEYNGIVFDARVMIISSKSSYKVYYIDKIESCEKLYSFLKSISPIEIDF